MKDAMTLAPTGPAPMTALSANVICMLSMLVWAAALPAAIVSDELAANEISM